MGCSVCWTGLVLLAFVAEAEEVVKDRQAFIPQQKLQPLPGLVVGALVGDVRSMIGQEGRSGPGDAFAFSVGGASYRWVYLPVADKPTVTNLRVPTGKGDTVKVYPSLGMANPQTLKPLGIARFALVEVQVNDGLGSPADQSFVATRIRRLDGTREYPLEVPVVVADLTKRYQEHTTAQGKTIEEALLEAQKAALKDKKPTGPRETVEVVYVTWLPDVERLRVHFRTRITDGAYQTVVRGVRKGPRPPQARGVRTGTSFGVEFGRGYEVDKQGKVVRTVTLPIQSFQRELPPVPAGQVGNLPSDDKLPTCRHKSVP
jgi:hypothetical protein